MIENTYIKNSKSWSEFSTKWLKNENKFGFTKSDMMLGGGMPVAINMMLSQAI